VSEDGQIAMLNAAVIIGQYYAFLSQALRRIFDSSTAAQVSDEVFDARLAEIRLALAPILEKNSVVKENLESVDRNVARIRQEAKEKQRHSAALQEAERYYTEIALRARTVSDLVGLFRRL